MTGVDADIEELVRAAKTPIGALGITYRQLQALQLAALERNYVVQTVEAYAVRGAPPIGNCVYPHSEYSADWTATVQASVDFCRLVLDARTDKESLHYMVWFDYRD